MPLLLRQAAAKLPGPPQDPGSTVRLQHAAHVGPVRVERIEGKGRGLVATRDAQPG